MHSPAPPAPADAPLLAPSGSGKFNEFQRTMLQWSHLHPYNAVHIVKVAGTVSLQLFESSIQRIARQQELGSLTIDPKRGRFRFHLDQPAYEPRLIDGGSGPTAALQTEVARQLNEPFPFHERFLPFRFFLMPCDDTTYLGIAYFHAIADAESIGSLLLAISAACAGRPPSAEVSGPPLHAGQALKVSLGPPWQTARRAISAVGQFQRMRQSHRPPACRHGDLRNEFHARTLTEADTTAALAKAKLWGVTLNDLCLAALLLAVAPVTASRHASARPQLTTACVVNLRSSLRPEERDRFGLCLGSFSVTHPVPEGISLPDLARDVSQETRKIKKDKLYLGAALTFWASRFMLSRMTSAKQRDFYRKSYPVWGSITNRRVDDLCGASGSTEVLDYLRAVSAGPAMPFVISVTGIAGRLNLGISSKPNVIEPDKMAGVIERFVTLLAHPELHPTQHGID